MFFQLLICIFSWLTFASAAPLQTKSGCQSTCGDVSIPYPFGIGVGCYQNSGLALECNKSFTPPRLLLGTIVVRNISLSGTMTIAVWVSFDCYNKDGTSSDKFSQKMTLSKLFTFSHTLNKFTAVGCDTGAFMSDKDPKASQYFFQSGCVSLCADIEDVDERSCSGIGCCQTAIPKGLKSLYLDLKSYYNHSASWKFNPCSYAFLADTVEFNFSRSDLSKFTGGMGLDFRNDFINETHIDECLAPEQPCEKTCTNTQGGYYCSCPQGYDDLGDKNKDEVDCILHVKQKKLPTLQLASGVTSISWDDRLRIAAETAYALAYLHSAPIIHRDIKSANILLDDNFMAKVADFGISKLVQLDQTQMSTLVQGTFGYLDPEYFNTSQLTEKSDVFSFGVVLVELLTGKKHVCSERSPEERSLAIYFNATLKANRLFQLVEPQVIDEGKSAQIMAYSDLAKRCLHMKGEERPTMKEAAAELEGLRRFEMHPWALQRNEENMSLLSEPQDIYSIELSSYTGDASGQYSMESSINCTVGYLNPEYYHTIQLTKKNDVLSFEVVLVELLTRKKPICSERSLEKRSLATYFPASLKENRLFQLVDPQIIAEGKTEQIIVYSELAKRCLNWKGEKRPTMKEIAMELEGLRRIEMHPWALQRNEESMSLLSEPQVSIEFSSYTGGDATGQYSMEVMLMNVPPW
ncbi:hypothetical protein GIB67_033785 [Kingdonia uniflora]|uniref:Protein kinase domain-containing protein n=1 Tax=Kingdonia uniflora TaxID=39325 RepID=A0A7J7P4K5_9MAGN|nr:hypothetical protein GIB67_033785 [Kingdonia uniflora]